MNLQEEIKEGKTIWEETQELDKNGKRKITFTKPIISNSKEENIVYHDNLKLFEKMTDFLRDSIDV
jgi:hypothetical protein